jgi:hypothetical protein
VRNFEGRGQWRKNGKMDDWKSWGWGEVNGEQWGGLSLAHFFYYDLI